MVLLNHCPSYISSFCSRFLYQQSGRAKQWLMLLCPVGLVEFADGSGACSCDAGWQRIESGPLPCEPCPRAMLARRPPGLPNDAHASKCGDTQLPVPPFLQCHVHRAPYEPNQNDPYSNRETFNKAVKEERGEENRSKQSRAEWR